MTGLTTTRVLGLGEMRKINIIVGDDKVKLIFQHIGHAAVAGCNLVGLTEGDEALVDLFQSQNH